MPTRGWRQTIPWIYTLKKLTLDSLLRNNSKWNAGYEHLYIFGELVYDDAFGGIGHHTKWCLYLRNTVPLVDVQEPKWALASCEGFNDMN